MARHTKYLKKMLEEFNSGKDEVISPDKLVKIQRKDNHIFVYHYDTIILVVSEVGDLPYLTEDGMSVALGEYAYSQSDARIINQVMENYELDYTAHTHKGELYLE